MRERNLLYVFLALNVALAGAFVAYLVLSNTGQPEIVSTNFPTPTKAEPARIASLPQSVKTNAATSNVAVTVAIETKPSAPTNQVQFKPIFRDKRITWEQVETEEYTKYLESLRAVGCPEEKVRYIIGADINELFARKRLKEAIAHDTQWWHAEPDMALSAAFESKEREFEEERRTLVTKLLGSEALEQEKGETMLVTTVQLTGPVLGNLPSELHNHVEEICARTLERNQSTFWARDNQSQPLNPVEVARMRDQTRTELKQVLNEEQMEEFLLRYSHNAMRLRAELRVIEPAPDEFRKAFRAIDSLDHQMQLQFGSEATMSEKQRERYTRQRNEALKEALGSERFQSYLLAQDPLYLQAQMFARQYGAPKAVMPIYQVTKANETRRQKIMGDPALSQQQKSEAISALYQEQQQSIQQMAGEAK